MSQHDMNIANADGATVRADLNNALGAIATCSSGATAPATTFAYQFWADTANDLLKQRNAANSAWISILTLSTGAPADADIPTVSATQAEMEAGTETALRSMSPLRVKQAMTANNVIINGAFGVNQRAVSGTVALSAGAYGHDRWKAGASGCTYTFSTTANITTLTISAGSLMQVVEGLNLQSGSYVMSWTGSAQGRINGGSYAGSGVTGTATGGTNLTVEFGTGTLSNVQLEAGATASSFGFRSYGAELALCQRYYEQLEAVFGYLSYPYTVGSDFYTYWAYKVTKRAVPTVTVTGTWPGGNPAPYTSSDGCWFNRSNAFYLNASGGAYSSSEL